MAQKVKRLPAVRETRVRSLGWEDPQEKEMATFTARFNSDLLHLNSLWSPLASGYRIGYDRSHCKEAR